MREISIAPMLSEIIKMELMKITMALMIAPISGIRPIPKLKLLNRFFSDSHWKNQAEPIVNVQPKLCTDSAFMALLFMMWPPTKAKIVKNRLSQNAVLILPVVWLWCSLYCI